MKNIFKDLLDDVKYIVADWKCAVSENGILFGLFCLFVFFIVLPFILLFFPFWLFNEWSKTWFDADDTNTIDL